MRLLLTLGLSVLCALPAGARKGSKRPGRKAATKVRAQKPPASIQAPAPAVSLDEISLFGLGVTLVNQNDTLVVAAVRPGSRADKAGLESGDQLLRLNGAATSSAVVAAKLHAWTPGTRLALIIRRGLELHQFQTSPIPAAPDYKRGKHDLSEHERILAIARSSQAVSGGRAVVKAIAPLTVPVKAVLGLWMRFPKGLPAGLKPGDELVAEAATGLTVDATLDYLAVPPGSKLRARVLKSTDDGEIREVRLAFYALDLNGGGTYMTAGHADAVSGDQRKAQVSEGGTIVAAVPLPNAKRRAPEPVLDDDARLHIRLHAPLIINEPPSYWRTGPGLWVKTVEDSGRRLFEITHSISGRSADAAGLKAGDRLDAIGGRSTEKMDFAEAIDRLYGTPGSLVEVSVVRAENKTLKLARGLRWSGGQSTPLPHAYDAQ